MSNQGRFGYTNRKDAGGWYALLEGRSVGRAGDGWRLRISGAVRGGAHTWVQLALVGAPNYNVLLRVDQSAEVVDALWAIELWLAERRASTNAVMTSKDRIIEVCAAPEDSPNPGRYVVCASL